MGGFGYTHLHFHSHFKIKPIFYLDLAKGWTEQSPFNMGSARSTPVFSGPSALVSIFSTTQLEVQLSFSPRNIWPGVQLQPTTSAMSVTCHPPIAATNCRGWSKIKPVSLSVCSHVLSKERTIPSPICRCPYLFRNFFQGKETHAATPWSLNAAGPYFSRLLPVVHRTSPCGIDGMHQFILPSESCRTLKYICF